MAIELLSNSDAQPTRTVKAQPKTYQKPKRLSKAGQWMRDNPQGIIIVHDRRAVNK